MLKRHIHSPIIRLSGNLVLIVSMLFGLTSCQPQPSIPMGSGLKVAATTSLVGDVVSQVGGDKVSVEVLLPLGTDPHSFSPTPRDASKIADAAILFENGAGLDEFLKPLLDNLGSTEKIVEVSQDIAFRTIVEEDSISS